MSKLCLVSLVAGLALLGAAAPAPAASDPVACRKAPSRACVLEAAEAAADQIASPFTRANALASIAANERRAGMDAAAAETRKRAEAAASQIPADSTEGVQPPAFAAMRAEEGDWSGALAYAQGLDNAVAKASAFSALALAEQRRGRDADAKAHFALAVAATDAVDPAQRHIALLIVARAQRKAGSADAPATFDRALEAAKALGKSAPRIIVYQRIRAGELDRAYVDIGDLPKDDQDSVLRALAGALARTGRVDQGAAVAAQIGRDSYGIEALTDLAVADFRAGRTFEAAQKLVKAAAIGDAASVDATKNDAKADIAGAEAAGGLTLRAKAHIAEVRAAIASETTAIFKEVLTQKLALALARAEGADAALEALGTIGLKMQGPYIIGIVDDFEAAGRPGEAFAMINAIPTPELRGAQLVDLLDQLPK